MAKKRSTSQINLWISLLVAVLALVFLAYHYRMPEPDGSQRNGSTAPVRPPQSSPGQPPEALPSPAPAAAMETARPVDANLPPDMAQALRNPPPELPADLKAQLQAPPPELPADLKRQLMAPPPPLPPDLKAQLQGPKPELPDDIKKAMRTPPRIVTLDEVNTPPQGNSTPLPK